MLFFLSDWDLVLQQHLGHELHQPGHECVGDAGEQDAHRHHHPGRLVGVGEAGGRVLGWAVDTAPAAIATDRTPKWAPFDSGKCLPSFFDTLEINHESDE